MVIIFNDCLTEKSFKDFSENLYDSLSKTPETDKLKIFFSTSGGSVVVMYAFYELINRYKDYIEIILGNQIASAGVILLHLLEDLDISVNDVDLEVMLHEASADVNTGYPDKPKFENDLKLYNKKIYNLFKKRGLGEEKLKEFKNGRDVYLSNKEFLEMFPTIKVRKYI